MYAYLCLFLNIFSCFVKITLLLGNKTPAQRKREGPKKRLCNDVWRAKWRPNVMIEAGKPALS